MLVTVPTLAGCGDDGSSTGAASAYCTDLQAAKGSITGLLDNDITQEKFDQLRGSLHTLAGESPGSVHAAWSTFAGAVDKVGLALDRAGLTMDDLREMGTGHMPGGTDMQTAMRAASSLGSVAVSNALSAMMRNTTKECHIDLNS